MERMKMLVGVDVDEEPAPATTTSAESSFAFMDDFNRHCTLSTQQRIHGFIICFVTGLTCTFLSMLVFFNPIKFGITFTLGNLLPIGRYSLSYIPFARAMVTKVLVACFDTEF